MMVSLGDRQPGLGGLLLTLGAAQVGLHVLLSLLGGHPHAGVGAQDATAQMITVHLALTLVTAWLLRSADDGLAVLGALLRRVLRLVLRRPVLPLPAAAPALAVPTVSWLLDVLFSRIPAAPWTAGVGLTPTPRVHPQTRTGAMATHRTISRALIRAATVCGVASAVALVAATPAFAHVTAQPGEAKQGGYTKIAFRTPNESPTAGTVKLEVTLPADHPITSVSTTPLPGWTAQVTKATLPAPVEGGHGTTITEAARTMTWTAQPGTRINPGEFLEFEVSMGPLPTDTDQLLFPAVQTYDDGTVVRWDQPPPVEGAAEPEHPAPLVRLVAASGNGSGAAAGAAGTTSEASDTTARWLGGARAAARCHRARVRDRCVFAGPPLVTVPTIGIRRALAVLSLVGLALLVGAGPAAAHNVLLGSDPPEGASLAAGPSRVSLRFDLPVRDGFNTLIVVGPDGLAYQSGAPEVERLDGRHDRRSARPGRSVRDPVPDRVRRRAPGAREGRVHVEHRRDRDRPAGGGRERLGTGSYG